MDKTLNGTFSRAELEDTLNVTEQLLFLRLKSLAKRAAPPPANTATFEDDPSPDPPKKLVVVEFAAATQLPQIIAQQLGSGRNLVCQARAYISGTETGVAVFR
jgi:hypothetical protein